MKKLLTVMKKLPHGDIDSGYVTEVEQKSIELLDRISQTENDLQIAYEKLTDKPETEQLENEVLKRCQSYKRASGNILKAYRKNVSMQDELSARWKDLHGGRKKKLIPKAPANAEIDVAESRLDHFARGMNVYKILMVCFMGSLAGVVVELLWCMITNGYLESRSGLVYGPFNLLYGAGAVALTAALYKFRNRGAWLSFIGGFTVGSAVEYICSWGQEALFGSRSWDYSQMPFNINGRICLMYSVFWGFLGVWWVKSVYPRMAKLILKLPNKSGKLITWALTVFFIFNSVVTVLAVSRWAQRLDGVQASNGFWEFIDVRFPDERMERVFANMEFTEKAE